MAFFQITSDSFSVSPFGANQIFRTSSGIPYVVGYRSGEIGVYKGNSATPTSFSRVATGTTISTLNQIKAVIDSTGTIHMITIFSSGKNSEVRYYTFDTSTDTWDSTTPEVVTTFDISDITISQASYCSIAVDSNDVPHVSMTLPYTSMGSTWGNPFYSNRVGGSWKTPINCTGGGVGAIYHGYDVFIGPDNIPRVQSNNDVYIGNSNNASSFTEPAITLSAYHSNTWWGNTFDSNSRYYHISHSTSGGGLFNVAFIDSSGDPTVSGDWTTFTITSGAPSALVTRFVVQPLGTDIYLFIHDEANDKLAYYVINGTTVSSLAQTDISIVDSNQFCITYAQHNAWDSGGNDISGAASATNEFTLIVDHTDNSEYFTTWAESTGNVTATPTAEDITINLQTPTISTTQNTTTTQTTEDILIDLQTPTISTSANTTYEVGFMTVPIDQLAPVVNTTIGTTTTPTSEEIAEALLQPTVSTTSNASNTPTTEDLLLTINTVTVATTTNVIATTTLIDLPLNLNTPTVSNATNTTILPDAIDFAFTQQAPTVSGDALTPAMGDGLTLDILSPTINTQVFATISAGQQSISLTEQNPTVSTVSNSSNTPTSEDIVFDLHDVTIATSTNTTINADSIDFPINQETPTIKTGVGVIPTPEDFAFSLLNVQTGSSVFVGIDLLDFSINQEGPTIQAVQNVSISEELQDFGIEALIVTVTTAGNNTTSPTTEDIVFDLYDITVRINKTVQPTAEDLIVGVNAATGGQFTATITEPTEEGFTITQETPTISTDFVLDMIDLDFFINDQSPIVRINKSISIDLIDEVIGVQNAIATGSANVLPSLIVLTETVLNATVNSGLLIGTNTTPLNIGLLDATASFTKTVNTTPTTEDATIDLFGVLISTTTNKTVTTTSEDFSINVLNVSVFYGSTIQPSEIDIQEEVQTPLISTIKSPVVNVGTIETTIDLIKPLTGVVFIESQDIQVDNLNVTIETSSNFVSTNPYNPNEASYYIYLFDFIDITIYDVVATGNSRYHQIEESIQFGLELFNPLIATTIGIDAVAEIQSGISFNLELFDAKGVTKEVEINAFELTAISPVITATTVVIINNTIRFGRFDPPIPFNFDLFDVSIIAQPENVVVSVLNIDFTLSEETPIGSLVENAVAYVNRLQFSVNDPTPYDFIYDYGAGLTPIYRTNNGAIVMTYVRYKTFNGGEDVTILIGDTGNFPNGYPSEGPFLSYPYTIIFEMEPLYYHNFDVRPQDCFVITEQNVKPFQDVIDLSIDLYSVSVSTTLSPSVSVDLLDFEINISNLEGVNLGTTQQANEDEFLIDLLTPIISTETNVALSTDEINVVVGDFNVMISASSIIDLNKIEFNIWQIYPDSPKTDYQVEISKYNAPVTIKASKDAEVTTKRNAKAVVTKEISFTSKIEC